MGTAIPVLGLGGVPAPVVSLHWAGHARANFWAQVSPLCCLPVFGALSQWRHRTVAKLTL